MASENGLPAEIDDLSLADPPSLDNQLSQFRMAWQREIIERQPSSSESSARNSPIDGGITEHNVKELQLAKLSKEDKAKLLFVEGIKAEENGNVLEAVDLYRRAIQLVPEVESMIDYRPVPSARERKESENSVEGCVIEEDEEELDLVAKFMKLQVESKTICQPDWEQRSVHISVLPVEVLVYIFKWVITNDLDMIALENVAMVCRGFYLCARDDEIWRRACLKIWGVNTGKSKKYGGWRNMYIERPHLRYNGCYISKASYVRPGERNVDNLYRAWHTVEYYRYLRFFPEGTILMITSPEDPVKILHKLKHRGGKPQGLLRGVYRMTDNKVTAVLKRVKTEYLTSGYARYKRRLLNVNQNEPERTFHLELEVCNAGRRKYAQMVWTHYSVHQLRRLTGEESVAEFDLNNKTYPPLYFSRVKSYTASADRPLQ
ncbi:F-box only protein 9-like [Liolophura sinensis]|uniref:F-box only protein 9-like n=1 Tax=Liolophura sinensis TaxID=3198878 RepID=UPI0031590CDF